MKVNEDQDRYVGWIIDDVGSNGSLRLRSPSGHVARVEFLSDDHYKNERQLKDLVMLVTRLVYQVRKHQPDNDVADKAMDYLRRSGLPLTGIIRTAEQ